VNSSQISDLVSRSTALRVKIVLQCDIVLLYKFVDKVMKAAKILKLSFHRTWWTYITCNNCVVSNSPSGNGINISV
jgi:hypothetical protein